jgi:hypothetical protein
MVVAAAPVRANGALDMPASSISHEPHFPLGLMVVANRWHQAGCVGRILMGDANAASANRGAAIDSGEYERFGEPGPSSIVYFLGINQALSRQSARRICKHRFLLHF